MIIIRKTLHFFMMAAEVFLFFISYPLAYVLYRRKNIWLISEIDFDARDNGFHLFRYINKVHRDINSIYVISRKNINYIAVRSIGNVIEPHSYKHLLIFIAAKYFIRTQNYGSTPSSYLDVFLKKYHFYNSKCINLHHGVHKDYYINDSKKNAKMDLVTCGAYPEYLFIKDNYGYSENEVVYTGLARFDGLYNFKNKKRIIFIPTWRRWLDCCNDSSFRESDFYIKWLSLLQSNTVSNLYRKGFEIIFYIHSQMNKYIKLFDVFPKYVTIFSSKNSDLQSLIKSSMLMITDFSSVFFDFAYMNKPVIYYQFDEKQFFEMHYTKSTFFDYRKNGFGPVCTKEEEVVSMLNSFEKNKFTNSKVYIDRSNVFFPLKDNHNCERIFNKINEL